MCSLCNLEGGKWDVALCENVREDLDRQGKHEFEEESRGLRMERMIRSQRYDDALPSSTARQKIHKKKLK